MVTGAEIALIKAATPAIERATGTSVGKIIPASVHALQHRLRNRDVRKRLKNQLSTPFMINVLAPDFAASLTHYIESSDFSALAMSVTTQHFADAGTKAQAEGLAAAKSNLRAAIDALPDVVSVDANLIVEELWRILSASVIKMSVDVKAAENLTAESRATVLSMASAFAVSDLQRSEFLRDMERLSHYYNFESDIKEQVKNLHGTMRLPHAGTTKRVTYRRLFVEPRFILKDSGPEPLESHFRYSAGLSDILRCSHRAVILGDPGGGKSTLSLKLTYDIARDAFQGSNASFPLLVILRDYTQQFEAGESTVVQYLESLCRSPYNIEPPEGFIEYALVSGRAYVIFDGLDELIDTSLRRRVVELVESFCLKYPATPVLVTTRKVGYQEAPLDENLFNTVQLGQLTDGDVKDYASKWFALDESIERRRKDELAVSFFQESRFVADLTQNPLLLALMCGIYASENYIPANRPDVYKKCAELLFDKWDKQRGIVTPLPFDAHVKHAINALAYSMYTRPNSESGLTYDHLIAFFKTFLLEKRFEDEGDAENAATQFVDFCTGRAWILSNIGSDISQELYGFTHRTFLEYFAANQLVRLNQTADRLFVELREKICRAEWDVVAQLALQILGNNAEDGIDDFLTLLLSAAEKEPVDRRDNLISFAARALSFAVPKPSIVREICDISLKMAISVPPKFQLESLSNLRALSAVMHASSENLPSVGRHVRDGLLGHRLKSLVQRETALALAVCITLIPQGGINEVSHMSKTARDFWEDFEKESINTFSEDVSALSSEVGWVALLRATVGQIPISNVINAFGPSVLFKFDMGNLILRPPFVYLASSMRNVEGENRWFMAAGQKCLENLAEILPEIETPWFTESYDYEPIGIFGQHGGMWRKPLSRLPELVRDTMVILGLAWTELTGDVRTNEELERSDNVSLLIRKWNKARLESDRVGSVVRSVKSCSLESRTIDFVIRWVSGDIRFVAPGVETKNSTPVHKEE